MANVGKDNLTKARALKPCPKCGREIGANNMSRHLGTHDSPAKKAKTNGSAGKMGRPKGALTKKQLTLYSASRAIGRYLDQVMDESVNGVRAGVVRLGALPGFPAATSDPDVIDRAAEAVTQKADQSTSRVQEIMYRQRAMTLRELAVELREGTADETEEAFIACAAEWAEEKGISYAAFREMGVTARVLKEAGIRP